MQQVWGTGSLQRRTNHQKPPYGSKTKIPLPTKVESYTDTNAVNMDVKNILESLLELLQKGSRNTRRPLPLYLTTVTPQVITSTISP